MTRMSVGSMLECHNLIKGKDTPNLHRMGPILHLDPLASQRAIHLDL